MLDSEMFYPGDIQWIQKASRDYVQNWYIRHRLFYHKILTILNISKIRGCILNLGCGGGALSCLLSNNENYTIGIDISATVVKHHQVRTRYHNLMVEGIVCDGSNLPFKSRSFDYIISKDVLEHSINPYHMLKEVFRVLTPGGFFFLSVPNKFSILSEGHSNWKNQFLKAIGKKLDKKVDYEHLFTSWELKCMLKKVGFIKIDFVIRKILFPFQIIFLRRGWMILARK